MPLSASNPTEDDPTAALAIDGLIAAVQYDDWFFAPDGEQYRVAFGPCTILRAKALLGFDPKNSANWYVQVGTGDRAVLLAGCRVHVALLSATLPRGKHVYDARSREPA